MSEANSPKNYPADNVLPPTRWSLIRLAVAQENPDAMLALEELCQLYQRPILTYILGHGYTPEQAREARQDFFLQILTKNAFATAEQTGHRFRAFIFQKLKSFLNDRYDHDHALKRGGGRVVGFGDLSEPEQRLAEPVDYQTPFVAAQMQWMETLVQSALTTIQLEYETKGLGERYAALAPFILRENEVTLASLAIRFDRSIPNLKSDIFRLRAKCMQSIRLQIAATLEDPSEANIDAELKELMGYRSHH